MHPRSGTLKRSNAFAGSKATQPVGNDGFKNDEAGMKKYEESSVSLLCGESAFLELY